MELAADLLVHRLRGPDESDHPRHETEQLGRARVDEREVAAAEVAGGQPSQQPEQQSGYNQRQHTSDHGEFASLGGDFSPGSGLEVSQTRWARPGDQSQDGSGDHPPGRPNEVIVQDRSERHGEATISSIPTCEICK